MKRRGLAWYLALRFGRVSALALASLVGCAQPPVAQGVRGSAVPTPPGTIGRLLSIVAHEDDDLLFINPTIDQAIKSGSVVRTVFVTAGDAGHDAAYWKGREDGVLAAYTRMTGSSGSGWAFDALVLHGHTVYRYALAGGRVSVVFLRIPDGNMDGSGFPAPPDDPYRPPSTSLWKLWSGEVKAVPVAGTWSTAAGASYTAAELKDVLGALLRDFAPTELATLDSTGDGGRGSSFFYGAEHSDHLHSAKLAFEAHLAYPEPHGFAMYRDYNIGDEPQNLTAAANAEKWSIFAAYAVHDASLACAPGSTCGGGCTQACFGGDYPKWTQRQYPIRQTIAGGGFLVGLAGRCLAAVDPSIVDGSSVALDGCRDVASQRWTIAGTQVQLSGTTKCLGMAGEVSGKAAVQISTCAASAAQRWSLADSGTLRGPGGLCLEARDATASQGNPVRASACVSRQIAGSPTYELVPEQRWSLRPSR